jgi:hypothetical protein
MDWLIQDTSASIPKYRSDVSLSWCICHDRQRNGGIASADAADRYRPRLAFRMATAQPIPPRLQQTRPTLGGRR